MMSQGREKFKPFIHIKITSPARALPKIRFWLYGQNPEIGTITTLTSLVSLLIPVTVNIHISIEVRDPFFSTLFY